MLRGFEADTRDTRHAKRLANARGGSSQGIAGLGPACPGPGSGAAELLASQHRAGRPAVPLALCREATRWVVSRAHPSADPHSRVPGSLQGCAPLGSNQGWGLCVPLMEGLAGRRLAARVSCPMAPGDDDRGGGRAPEWQRECQPSKRGKQLRLDLGANPAQGDPLGCHPRTQRPPPWQARSRRLGSRLPLPGPASPAPRHLLALGGISNRDAGSE